MTNRLKNSTLNISTNTINYFLQTILSFLVRTVFIRKLGAEILGLDSLLINVLTALSLAELGFSSAISYGLYKPLAEKKVKKISAYMSFYKKVYTVIGIFLIFVGFVIALFLKKIVGDISYSHLYTIYFLYLFNTVFHYFIAYKDILLLADQKNYKIFKYNCLSNIILYVLQFISILVFSNYIIYILIMVVVKLLNKIIVNRYISKYYKHVDFNSQEKLSSEDIKKIKSNITGLLFYKIGDYAINCTDNIIISAFINVVTVGIYTNYLSIITIIRTIIKNIFSGITASYGNLSVEGNNESKKNVFNIMSFIGFVVSGFVVVCFLNLINPFIQIWIGKKYLLPVTSVIIIVANFYLMCNQMPLDTVKESHGFYKKDRYVPIIQAVINIILSVVLVNFIGFNGVIIGTTISYLLTVFWNKPFVIYKYIFKESSFKYFTDQIKYILTIILVYFITFSVFNYLNFSINFVNILLMGIILSVIYFAIIILFYHKREEFKFIIDLLKNAFCNIFRKKEVK